VKNILKNWIFLLAILYSFGTYFIFNDEHAWVKEFCTRSNFAVWMLLWAFWILIFEREQKRQRKRLFYRGQT
jgi:hypothetical protein